MSDLIGNSNISSSLKQTEQQESNIENNKKDSASLSILKNEQEEEEVFVDTETNTNNDNILVIISCLSGNIIEYYDYNVYGYVSDAIGDVFFPSQSGNASLIESYTVFGCAFLMRPIGALLIGYIGDKYSPKHALEVSLFLMAIPTFLIGCLPTYDTAGWGAPILLVLCRMLQGLSFGGQITSSFMFILEKYGHSDKSNWGYYGGFVLCSGYIGSLFGSLFGYAIRSTMSYDNLKLYGWRLPFLLGIILCFPGYYIKFYAIEHKNNNNNNQHHQSPSQSQQIIDACSSYSSNVSINPMKEAFRIENRQLFVSITLMSMLGTAVFNLSFIWMPIYMDELISTPVPQPFLINSLSILVSLCMFTPISGVLSDAYGRMYNMIFGAFGIAIFGSLLLIIISISNSNPYYVFTIQCLLGISFSTWTVSMWVWCMENLPAQIRLTTFSVAYNIASSLVGGFTPSIATIMVDYIGPVSPCIIYIILVIFALCGVIHAPFFKNVNYYFQTNNDIDNCSTITDRDDDNNNDYIIYPDDAINNNNINDDDNDSHREDSNMLLEQLLMHDTEKIIL